MNLRLPDGSRMAAMIPPVVNPRPAVTIRKFTSRNFTLADLVRGGMLTEEQVSTLTYAVRTGENILIAGGTGSGKTTLLNVLADAIPEDDRILIIEDTAEHRSQVTFDDLLKAVLRHRPDRILVGEVRGAEARTLLDAMNTGHRGTMATIHASSAEEALHRLATLALRAGGPLSLDTVATEARRCLDLVIYISRCEGRRFIESVMTVTRT